MKLQVLVTSSSRPQLWPYFLNSFNRMCIIRERPEFIVHEDFVFRSESNEVLKYLEGKGLTVNTNDPAIGLGSTLTHYFRNILTADYIFYIQEDWIFERPIDIDQITWVMDNNPNINLIFFNKIRNVNSSPGMNQDQRFFSGMPVCIYHGWTFLPGIWRRDFVLKNMLRIGGFSITRPEGNFTNVFGSHEQRKNNQHCEEKIGAYIYGPTGDFRYVRHTGNDWRMARWRLERKNNHLVPGGNHNSQTMDLPYMAPWVPYIETPSQRGDLGKV